MTLHRLPRPTAVALATVLLTALVVPGAAAQVADVVPAQTAASLSPADAAALLLELRVEDESPLPSPADAFGPWVDADGDGCDTAAEVLVAESLLTVTPGPGCTVDVGHSGLWQSPWDGGTVGAGVLPVVEHAVPLVEAWRSGAHAWTAQDRSDLANDLGFEDALRAVTPMVSEARGDRDPADWLPPVAAARCGYVSDWVGMKWRWDLAVDPAERDVLAAVLDGCGPWPLYKTPYAGTIYELVTHPDGSQAPVPLTFARWRDVYDFAPFAPSPTEIVRYPWSSTLYAVTYWPGEEDAWTVQRLTFAQWQHAGFAAPTDTAWIPRSTLHRYATATQIFLVSPAGGVPHKLSYAEWAATGFAPYEDRENEGFLKYPWGSGVFHVTDLDGTVGTLIGYPTWAQLGFPNPLVVGSLPGDRVIRRFGSPTIYYTGDLLHRAITYAEWQRMGFPSPEVVDRPSSADKDCTDYSSAQEMYRDYSVWRSEGYGDIFGLDADHDGVPCEGFFGPL